MDGSVARPRPFLALGLRLGSAAALATMAMLVKLAGERGAALTEMIFWRQALTFVCITALLTAMGRLSDIKTRRIGAHLRRAAYGLTGMFFVYGAVILLPLAEATAISFTAPFFAVMLGAVLFGEKPELYRWGAVALGFAGVLVLTAPEMGLTGGNGVDPAGALVALVAAFLVALISVQIQDLNTTESPWSIVFWFTALTTPVMALALPFVFQPHPPEIWGLIILMSLCGVLAQLLLTASLRFGSAGVVLLMDYTALLWATGYGYAVFDRAPPASLWLGAPLIVGAGALIAWRERQRAVARARSIAVAGTVDAA
jgi:drug/metabolite transporter (DMT)-like permease